MSTTHLIAYTPVEGLVSAYHDAEAESVTEVFEWLRPPGSPYKTNTEFEIGRKVIVSALDCGAWKNDHACRGARGEWDVNYYQQQHLTGLDNVFHYLDGQPRPEGSYHGPLYDAIKTCGVSGCGETVYFRFRCYHNGNLHLEFKRLDLVQQLNAVAGGNRLRYGTAAA